MRRLLGIVVLFAACKSDPVVVVDPSVPPQLGIRIFDRTGRAAVNTALVGIVMSRGDKNAVQQSYNQAEPAEWPTFAGEIAANLAIFDALDAVCGNQFLAGANETPDRYSALANALADDQLYLNTNATECDQYLAVELDATQVAPNQDCGGRTPRMDVIDVTYSALAFGGVEGVGDGVAEDPRPTPDEFPYLAR